MPRRAQWAALVLAEVRSVNAISGQAFRASSSSGQVGGDRSGIKPKPSRAICSSQTISKLPCARTPDDGQPQELDARRMLRMREARPGCSGRTGRDFPRGAFSRECAHGRSPLAVAVAHERSGLISPGWTFGSRRSTATCCTGQDLWEIRHHRRDKREKEQAPETRSSFSTSLYTGQSNSADGCAIQASQRRTQHNWAAGSFRNYQRSFEGTQ